MAKSQNFDISTFEKTAADTADMTVRNPANGEPTPWIITFAGPSHPKRVALEDKALRDVLKKNKTYETQRRNGKRVKVEDQSPEELRRENAEAIADQIISWTGATIEFDRDVAVEKFMDPRYRLLVEQINEFLADDAIFIRNSATT